MQTNVSSNITQTSIKNVPGKNIYHVKVRFHGEYKAVTLVVRAPDAVTSKSRRPSIRSDCCHGLLPCYIK